VASINIFEDEDILNRARRMGSDVLAPGLEDLKSRHPSVGEVRGLGCFWAIELVRNRDTREMFVPFNASGADAAPMAEVLSACKEAGLSPFAHFNRIHIAPPLNISDEDARLGLSILDEVLDIADRHTV
ncbi:MAG TPA: aminotransferase class III-fold pyridoxal phosphate-dependent enzyme, partial [Microthrixaceae bacterium]|nr:aminotransferase class III-fold pyridoxal phosphate-dependent enzyme [Microthrixaceae bacterium]